MNDLPTEVQSVTDERLQQLIERGPEGIAAKQWNELLDEWLRRAEPASQPLVLGNMLLAPKAMQHSEAVIAATLYEDVPWFRRSHVNSRLLLFGLVFPPAMACVCGNLLTGDIYYKKLGADGSLKTWSRANRSVALVVFGAQLLAVAARLWVRL